MFFIHGLIVQFLYRMLKIPIRHILSKSKKKKRKKKKLMSKLLKKVKKNVYVLAP